MFEYFPSSYYQSAKNSKIENVIESLNGLGQKGPLKVT